MGNEWWNKCGVFDFYPWTMCFISAAAAAKAAWREYRDHISYNETTQTDRYTC